MRQNYFKNAALLTGSDVVLRLAGMGLRIWLANALGGAGMGLYQLVLAVYGLFVTLATAGISVAATRLLTEELRRAGCGGGWCWQGLRGAGLPWSPSLPPQALRQNGGWGMSAPLPRCAPRRWGCRGWRSRRCCAAFFWRGGGWSRTCSASWQSRRCVLPPWCGRFPARRAGRTAVAARWCWRLPP